MVSHFGLLLLSAHLTLMSPCFSLEEFFVLHCRYNTKKRAGTKNTKQNTRTKVLQKRVSVWQNEDVQLAKLLAKADEDVEDVLCTSNQISSLSMKGTNY